MRRTKERKKRKDRRSIVLLCALLAAGTVGCQQDSLPDHVPYFIFAAPLVSHPIWLQARQGFLDACKDLNVKGDWLGPSIIDPDRMNDVLETGILQKADGMVTQGVVSREVLRMARDAGIPVVLVDGDMEPMDRLSFLGKNFHQQAELFLADIEKRLGLDVPLRIAIQVANLEFDIGLEQVEEIQKVFASHPGGFTIVSLSQSLSDEVRSRKEWERVFKKDRDINVVLNFAAEAGICAVDAAQAAGLADEVLIYGVDDMAETIRCIEEGKLTGSVVTSFYQYGYQSVKVLDTYRKTLSAHSIYSVPLELWTRESLKKGSL